MLRLRRPVGDHLAVPVGLSAEAACEGIEVLLCVVELAAVDVGASLFVPDGHRVEGVGELRHRFGFLDSERAVVVHLCLANAALLRSDEEHAVGGAYAVDGGGCVLEHRYVGDVVGVDALEILYSAGHSVDYYEGRTHAADIEVIVVCAGLGALLPYTHAGDLTGKHVLRVLVVGLDHCVALKLRHGARDRASALNAVAHYHYLFECFRIVAEGEVDGGASLHRFLYGIIADIADHEHVVGIDRERVVAVKVGRGSVGGVFHHYCRSDERFVFFVSDCSPYGDR